MPWRQLSDLVDTVQADPESKWEHVVQHARGTVGETALHLCLLLATPDHRRRLLIKLLADRQVQDRDDEQVCALDASYLGQPYTGEVALHFAAIQQDLEMVRLLTESGANVNRHASGDFLYSNIGVYFGGSVLGFAACVGNFEIVDYLVAHGANVDAVDLGPTSGKELDIPMAVGNTVLHCCIIHSKENVPHLTSKHGANQWVRNEYGQTLLVATASRSPETVQHVLDEGDALVVGPATCVRYPLYEIETAEPEKASTGATIGRCWSISYSKT